MVSSALANRGWVVGPPWTFVFRLSMTYPLSISARGLLSYLLRSGLRPLWFLLLALHSQSCVGLAFAALKLPLGLTPRMNKLKQAACLVRGVPSSCTRLQQTIVLAYWRPRIAPTSSTRQVGRLSGPYHAQMRLGVAPAFFGSEHFKPFRFLDMNIALSRLAKRCCCHGQHVRVQGAYTKASATYVPRLVEALADRFHQAMLDVQGRRTEGLDLEVGGLENQLVNEVALASSW